MKINIEKNSNLDPLWTPFAHHFFITEIFSLFFITEMILLKFSHNM